MNDSNRPLVTIGIPVYNGEKHLEEAIKSVLGQTRKDLKLMIYDNCSTDGTQAICRHYAGADERVEYQRKTKNLGAAANFASLVADAKGEFFMFLAHDDTIGPRFVELTVAELHQSPNLASAGIAPYDRPCLESLHKGYIGLEEPTASERIDSFVTLMADGNARFYSMCRLSLLKQIDLLTVGRFAGDWAIFIELLKLGGSRIIYDRENGYKKTEENDSATRRAPASLRLRDVFLNNPFEAFCDSLPPNIKTLRRAKLRFMWFRFALRFISYKVNQRSLGLTP